MIIQAFNSLGNLFAALGEGLVMASFLLLGCLLLFYIANKFIKKPKSILEIKLYIRLLCIAVAVFALGEFLLIGDRTIAVLYKIWKFKYENCLVYFSKEMVTAFYLVTSIFILFDSILLVSVRTYRLDRKLIAASLTTSIGLTVYMSTLHMYKIFCTY